MITAADYSRIDPQAGLALYISRQSDDAVWVRPAPAFPCRPVGPLAMAFAVLAGLGISLGACANGDVHVTIGTAQVAVASDSNTTDSTP